MNTISPVLLRTIAVPAPTIKYRSVAHTDSPALATFRAGLLPDTIYNRYFSPLRLTDGALQEWAENLILRHPCRQFSWVAATDTRSIVALLELVPDPIDLWHAEMGIVVSDAYQNRGIGTSLGRYVLQVARRLGIRQVSACMLADNRGAQKFIRKLNTRCVWQDDGELRIVTMTL